MLSAIMQNSDVSEISFLIALIVAVIYLIVVATNSVTETVRLFPPIIYGCLALGLLAL